MTRKRFFVTGATGKVGRAFIHRVLSEPQYQDWTLRALCHQRELEPNPRLDIVKGAIEKREVVEAALEGVTHVLHLATCKETPDKIMDVTVKGLFWLLEACRQSESFQQFILIGGDAALGHFHYPHPMPVTETQAHTAYPGCYALSKVLEEVMLEQYYFQYDLNGCCLRAPWIMEKDDLKFHLSFGEDVFGAPRWRDLVGAAQADAYQRDNTVPILLDANGDSMRRNFVHVSDLVNAMLAAVDHPKARQQTFNICMDEPLDYRALARHLSDVRNLPSVEISSSFHSTWLDNSKAKFLLGWKPRYDLKRLADEAFGYQRAQDDARMVWYPG